MGTSQEKAKALLANGIGHISRLPSTTGLDPARCAEQANHIQGFLVGQTRLGIPAIVHEECLSGAMTRGATSFPQAIGLASTWSPELAQAMTPSSEPR